MIPVNDESGGNSNGAAKDICKDVLLTNNEYKLMIASLSLLF